MQFTTHIYLNTADVSCYCSSKTRNSVCNSQLCNIPFRFRSVVIALVKLEILYAIHNADDVLYGLGVVVIALVKLEILYAIHNSIAKLR